jgi:hypothetical protein
MALEAISSAISKLKTGSTQAHPVWAMTTTPIKTLQINILVIGPVQKPSAGSVGEKTHTGHQPHDLPIRQRRTRKSDPSLPSHREDHQEKGEGISQGRQDFKARESKSVCAAIWALGQDHGGQGNEKGRQVRQHVARVGQKRQAPRKNASHCF